MNNSYTKPLIALSLASSLLLSGAVHAKIVCWTNSDGFRECGNAVPPEYAQTETRTINERGRTTEIKERAKTKKEIAAAKALDEKQKKIEAEEEKRQKARAAYDRVLLATYLNEADILRSRGRQSRSIDDTIEVTKIGIDKLQGKLNDKKKKAANLERRGKSLPKRLEQDINSLQEQISNKNKFIQSKESEKNALKEKFDAEIARFRELKAKGVKLR